jgi:hypothetical protein
MSSIESVLTDISNAEIEIRKRYPKQKGRVIIQNIKHDVDATVTRQCEIKWSIEYRSKLLDRLKEHNK